jgi:hypothetical protein
MRTLTSSLLAAQKSASRTPAVQARARNLLSGTVNLRWTRLYSGTEPEGPHSMAIPEDGSMIRTRITPASDGRKLYRQRVTNPGPEADFSIWTYLNQYNVMAVAICSLSAEASLFWIKSNGEIDRSRSANNGYSWPTTDYPGYAPSGSGVTAAAAAYKPNGDLALFFTDTAALYIIISISGVWQARTAWNKMAGSLSGVSTTYDGDWKLLVSGTDTSGNPKIWSIIYGDGREEAFGSWSALKEIVSAPSGGGYEYKGIFLDKMNTETEEEQGITSYRCFFSENYIGNEANSRPFASYTLPNTAFLDNRWREPIPFNADNENGLAMAQDTDYAWLSSPDGVWRAEKENESLDLSENITASSLKLEQGNGELSVEIRNDKGQYSDLETSHSPLYTGCRIDFSPGYRTHIGKEYCSGLSFTLEAYEYGSSPGKAILTLYAADGWRTLENWIARFQLRWNQTANETNIKEIIAQILAKSGLRLEAKSQSTAATNFYPNFTIHPGDNGKETIERLISFIPDIIFLEGDTAYLVDPLAADPASYSYFSGIGTPGSGSNHLILEGRYRTCARRINRVRAEGPDIVAESLAWDEIEKKGDILRMIEDLNLTTASSAHNRGEATLRKTDIDSISGYIKIPTNCGQQIYDVIAITDPSACQAATKRRILGIDMNYLPAKAIYEQKLKLGGV